MRPALLILTVLTVLAPLSALAFLYGNWDEARECSVQKPADVPPTLVTVEGAYEIPDTAPERVLLITAANPEGWDSHGQAPTIGGALFEKVPGGWKAAVRTPEIARIGSFGKPPDGRLVQIGPKRWGLRRGSGHLLRLRLGGELRSRRERRLVRRRDHHLGQSGGARREGRGLLRDEAFRFRRDGVQNLHLGQRREGGRAMKWVVFNQKGGVGKSTIVCNLAAISGRRGRKTLVVDLDPQGNSSQYLLGREAAANVDPHLGTFFEEMLGLGLFKRELREMIHPTPVENVDILPSSPLLETLHGKLEAKHKIGKLRKALAELDGYEAVYLDTPPAFGFFTLSALIAADRCLIPFDCDDFSRQALYTLLESLREIREDHNPRLQVAGIVVNQFQSRANLPQQLVDELIAEGLPILEPFISSSVKVRESHHAAKPLVVLDPSHKLSLEFEELFTRIEKGKKGGKKKARVARD